MKLREMREAEDSAAHRNRTGRLAKWQELVREAAKERSADVEPPQGIEILVCVLGS